MTSSALVFTGVPAEFHIGTANPQEWQTSLTGDLTVEFWLRPARLGVRQNPIAKAWGGELAVTLEPEGSIRFFCGSSGQNDGPHVQISSGAARLRVDHWTHVAFVRTLGDGLAQLRCHIDGLQVAETTVSLTSVAASARVLRLGQGYAGPFAGALSELRLWNVARSTADIADERQRRLTGGEVGLVGYWPLDEGVGDRPRDRSAGRRDAIAQQDGFHWGRSGAPDLTPVGPCLRFDGSEASRVELPQARVLRLGPVFTQECWIRPRALDDDDHAIVGGQGDETSFTRAPGLWIKDRSRVSFGFGTGHSWVSGLTGPVLSQGVWNHLAASYDGSRYRIYVDGQEVFAVSLGQLPADTAVRSIGWVDNGFVGDIAELRLWTSVRSPEQIRAGMAGLDEATVFASRDLAGYWPLDDGPLGVARDRSIHRSDGRLGGAATWVEDLRVLPPRPPTPALSLCQAGAQVVVRRDWPDQLTGSQTLELWLCPDELERRMNPLAKAYGGEGAITVEPDGRVSYYFGTAGDHASPHQGFWSPKPVLRAGVWTHLAIVRDLEAMQVRLLVNAVEVGRWTIDPAFAEPAASERPWLIGAGYVHDFRGELAEVRLWSRARSNAEIAALAGLRLRGDEPGVAGYWSLDAGEGTRARARGGAADGELQPGAGWRWTAPLPVAAPEGGPALRMLSGGGRLVDAAPGFGNSADLTLELWLRPQALGREQTIMDYSPWGTGTLALLPDGRLRYTYGRIVYGTNHRETQTIVSDEALRPGIWVHVAVVRDLDHDSGTLRLFVNAELVAEQAATIFPHQRHGGLQLGNGRHGPLLGELAEFRAWHRVRSHAELAADLSRRVSGREPGLAYYLPMLEGFGTRTRDAASTRGPAVLEGAVRWVDSGPRLGELPVRGLVQRFAGAEAAITITHQKLAQSGDLTVELWLRAQQLGAPATIYGHNRHHQGDISIDADGRVRYEFGGPSGVQLFTMNDPLVAGEWTHLALVREFSRGRLRWFRNGELSDEAATQQSSAPTSSLALTVGSGARGQFYGELCELRLWSRGRSGAEIQAGLHTRLARVEPGLVGVWFLDDPTDSFRNRIVDAVEYPRPTASGRRSGPVSAAFVDAPFDLDRRELRSTALEFSGAGQVELPDHPALALGPSFTQECWLHPEAPDDSWYGFIGDTGQAPPQLRAPSLWVKGRTRVHFGFGDGEQWQNGITGPVLTPRAWNHVAASFDGNRYRIYVNGTLVHEQAMTGLPVATRVAQLSRGAGFYGRLSEVRLWSVARTRAQILDAMYRRLSRRESNLLACWRLDFSAGPVVPDSGPLGLHGQLHGHTHYSHPGIQLAPALAVNSDRRSTAPIAVPDGGSSVGEPTAPPVDIAVDPSSEPAPELAPLLELGELELSLFFTRYALPVAFDGTVTVQPFARAVEFRGAASLPAPFGVGVDPLRVAVFDSDDDAIAWMLAFDYPHAPLAIYEQLAGGLPGTVRAGIEALVRPYLELFADATVVLASVDGEDEALGTYVAGCNLFTTAIAADVPPFGLLHAAFPSLGLDQRELVLGLGTRAGSAGEFFVGATLSLGLALGTDMVVLDSIGLNIARDSNDLTVGAEVLLKLDLAGEILHFVGGLSASAGTGASTTVWGSLAAADGAWDEPFGIPGITLVGLGVEVGPSATPPFFVLGLRGEAYLGGGLLGGSVGIRIGGSDFVLDVRSERGLSLPAVLAALTGGWIDLSGLLDIAIEDLQLTLAPSGGSIAGQDYPAGLTLAGRLDLVGFSAAIDGRFDHDSGGHLRGAIEPITIAAGGLTFLRLTATDGSAGAAIDLEVTPERIGGTIDGLLSIAGIVEGSTTLQLSSEGFTAAIDSSQSLFATSVRLRLGPGGFALSYAARIQASLDLGAFSVSVGVGCTIAVEASAAAFVQEVGFELQLFGERIEAGPFRVELPFTSPADLLDAFAELVKLLFEDLVQRYLKLAAIAAFRWVRAFVTQIADEAVQLFRELGVELQRVAEGVKLAGYAVIDSAVALAHHFEVAAEEAIAALGLSAEQAGEALRVGFAWTVEQVHGFLTATMGQSAEEAGRLLKVIGFGADEVLAFLDGAFPDVDWPGLFDDVFPDVPWDDLSPF